MTKHRLLMYGAAGVLLLLWGACAQQEGTSQGGDTGATTIGVKLQEWSVGPDDNESAAGDVTFEVSNVGERAHEFKVAFTDLDLTQLPTNEDGSFDEEGEDVELVDANAADEAQVIQPGNNQEFTFDLQEGSYVLMCNLVEEDEVHFKQGMRIPFTVSSS